MSDNEARLAEFQRRITSALDRIGQGVNGYEVPQAVAPQVDTSEIDALKQALEDERTANAQLEERNRALNEKITAASAEIERAMADQRASMVQLDQDLQRLRMANDQLRDNNQALRKANEAGVGEPHLINKSMLTELEALRAARATDRSEADAIVAALAPLVANGTAPAGEES
ncbi:MAG: hypothetical protein ACRBBU_05045 [Pseudooceanicola sp.]